MAISSQQVIGTAGATTGDIRTGETYPSDQYSQIQVTSTAADRRAVDRGGGAGCRTAGRTRYVGLYYWNFGSPELMLFKRSRRPAAGPSWAARYNSGHAGGAGRSCEVAAVGSTISFLQNGVQRGSRSRTASFDRRRAGHHGLSATSDQRGQLVRRRLRRTRRRYTVGGTVSGLSGTVVLQDNGGDNLSVTANGSFTFATALASGAAYSVTVKTNPSGQTCTVSSGSGTIGSANVTNVAVSCANAATFSVGGTVSGLSGRWCCRITAGTT